MDDIERAAIVLLGMGEQRAAQVLKHMEAKQVEKVVMKMADLKHVTPEEANKAVQDFNQASSHETSLGVESKGFIKNTLVNAFGEEKAGSVLDKTFSDCNGIDFLQWQDATAVSSLIRDEHPQIIAVILTHIDGEKAADIIAELPSETRQEVMRRIVKIGPISPQALQELNSILEESAKEIRSYKKFSKGGAELAANIMNYVKGELEEEFMTNLTEFDGDISEKVQGHLFPFEKLLELDKRSLQTLLREVSSDDLLLALKGVDEETREIFFANMSERAADMLKDDLEAKGPVQLSKVIEGQKEIIASAQRMAKNGDIVLAGKGEKMV